MDKAKSFKETTPILSKESQNKMEEETMGNLNSNKDDLKGNQDSKKFEEAKMLQRKQSPKMQEELTQAKRIEDRKEDLTKLQKNLKREGIKEDFEEREEGETKDSVVRARFQSVSRSSRSESREKRKKKKDRKHGKKKSRKSEKEKKNKKKNRKRSHSPSDSSDDD